jgi:putative transposase
MSSLPGKRAWAEHGDRGMTQECPRGTFVRVGCAEGLQLREATPFGQHPKHVIRDNDSKFGPAFTALAAATGIDEVRTAYRAPKENAFSERLLGTVRRECLDHLLILNEAHLRRVLREYMAYYNTARPHQGLGQRIPDPPAASGRATGAVYATPVLGGLHHAYARAA